jgi:hypothetical protein
LLNQLDGKVAAVHREQLGHLTREQLETLGELLTLARTPPR